MQITAVEKKSKHIIYLIPLLEIRAVILVIYVCGFNFPGRFSKNTQISNFIKIRPVGDKLFHEDGRTDGHTDLRS